MFDASDPEELSTSLFDEEQALRTLADCLYEHFQSVPQLESEDPFEYYAHQLRAGWYKDRAFFSERFLKGYHLIKKGVFSDS